jgi:hypothetical protein
MDDVERTIRAENERRAYLLDRDGIVDDAMARRLLPTEPGERELVEWPDGIVPLWCWCGRALVVEVWYGIGPLIRQPRCRDHGWESKHRYKCSGCPLLRVIHGDRAYCSGACRKRAERRRKRARRLETLRACEGPDCEEVLTGRTDQRYCSDRCRKAAGRVTDDAGSSAEDADDRLYALLTT